MTVKLKIIIGAIAALVVLLLMLLWAFFAYQGRPSIAPFIYQISALITVPVGLISAFFGHQSAPRDAGALTALSIEPIAGQPLTAPLPPSLVNEPEPTQVAQAGAPPASVQTLQ